MGDAIDPASSSARYGERLVKAVLALTLLFLLLPVFVTFVGSFAKDWTGVLPSGFVTFEHWTYVLGIGGGVEDAAQRSLRLGQFIDRLPAAARRFPSDPLGAMTVFSTTPLFKSVFLALGGVAINLVVGIPIAYAVARYDFPGKNLLNVFAILPLAPGVILGVAFLWTYPALSTETDIGLIVGYSLLKAPFMVMAVQSSFESMPLRQIEESARSLGASWTRTFLTVIVPNAGRGIVAGSIICWTLAAAEFNFSYMVQPRGTQPLALFLKAHISHSSYLTSAAAVSVFFLLVAGITALLRVVGTRGFSLETDQ